MAKTQSRLAAVLKKHESDLLQEWTKDLKAGGSAQDRRISESELQAQAKEFLALLQQAAQSGDGDSDGPAWHPIRDFLEGVSRSRVQQGFTSDQTAKFIFSLKRPLFARLSSEVG